MGNRTISKTAHMSIELELWGEFACERFRREQPCSRRAARVSGEFSLVEQAAEKCYRDISNSHPTFTLREFP